MQYKVRNEQAIAVFFRAELMEIPVSWALAQMILSYVNWAKARSHIILQIHSLKEVAYINFKNLLPERDVNRRQLTW